MRLIESADGTIQVVELDPTTAHILIIEADALIGEHISLRDGAIIIRRPGGGIAIVESDREAIESTKVEIG